MICVTTVRQIPSIIFTFFFFNDPPTTDIYTLSLHDALPISNFRAMHRERAQMASWKLLLILSRIFVRLAHFRSEEHTSELQSHSDLVCRLLLEKKKENERQRRDDPRFT